MLVFAREDCEHTTDCHVSISRATNSAGWGRKHVVSRDLRGI